MLCVTACGGPSGPGATSGGGGSGNAGGAGAGGTGGSGSVDLCALKSMNVCQNPNCHGGAMVYADLHLDNNVLTTDFAPLVDKPNHGDPAGCPPGFGLLIDSSDAMKSLMYTKLSIPAPCGKEMPVIGTFLESDKMCMLSWIQSVIAVTHR
jgi:hypothetical protein